LVRYRLHSNSLSVDASGQQETTRAIIENHFGPDDGQPQNWTAEKRRAYGGVYRLYVLTSVQRQNDWQAASRYLKIALYNDPTLAMDLNFFYDLALGNQPPGYRGTSYHLNLEENAARIACLLANVFTLPLSPELNAVHRQTLGTAYFAIGLAVYNLGTRSSSRNYFIKALCYRPGLIFDARLVGDFLKSFVRKERTEKFKKLVGRF
jgi:hypothetical protein